MLPWARKGVDLNESKTTFRSQHGGARTLGGRWTSKDLRRSLKATEEDIVGRQNLKTDDNIDLYPRMAETDNFLERCRYKRNSATLGMVGRETENP